MVRLCDNTSIGVILRDTEGKFAFITRARDPVGIAPVAGHIDDFGFPEAAAAQELHEELGIKLSLEQLNKTAIYNRKVDNVCRRPGGSYHMWYVFEATVPAGTELHPSKDETKGAQWYNGEQLRGLLATTHRYQSAWITKEEWEEHPGLEPVWVGFMTELGYGG